MQGQVRHSKLSIQPQTDEEKSVKARYDKVRGSAVNPVLRETNLTDVSQSREPIRTTPSYGSLDRRLLNLTWPTLVETSLVLNSHAMDQGGTLRIVFVDSNNNKQILKDNIVVNKGDIVDSSFMYKHIYSIVDEQTKC